MTTTPKKAKDDAAEEPLAIRYGPDPLPAQVTVILLDANHREARRVTVPAPVHAQIQVHGVNYTHVGDEHGVWTFVPF